MTTAALEQLTALETIALSKAVKDSTAKESRGKLEEGQHQVDFTVRIHGPVLVAPSTPAKEKEKIPPAALLALALGCVPKRSRSNVLKTLTEALVDWKAGAELAAAEAEAQALADEVLALACRERSTVKNGTVTAPLQVDVIERA